MASSSHELIADITEHVLKKLSAANPHLQLSSSQYAETSEPTVTSNVMTEKCDPPLGYQSRVTPIDLNDSFDRNNLLKKIPTTSKKRAQQLLEAFDGRPNELTWDPKGKIEIAFAFLTK